MASVPGVLQWWLKSAMEMPVPSPEEVSKTRNFDCSYCFIIIIAGIWARASNGRGCQWGASEVHPELGADGVHWEGKNDPGL